MIELKEKEKIWESAKVPPAFPIESFFGEVLLEKLKETPSRVCQISIEDSRELTCEELRVKSIRVAQNLTRLGITSGDVVGMICRHSHELTMALYGCILIGAPVNPLDLSFTKDDVKQLFGQTRPKLVICDSDQVTKVQEALSELNNNARIYSFPCDGKREALIYEQLFKPTGMEEAFIPPKFDQPTDEKVMVILCSSGTTGAFKGVMMSHATMFAWMNFALPVNRVTRTLCFSVFYWGSGFFPHLCVAFRTSDTRIMPRETFNVDKLSQIVAKFKPTDLTVPPLSLSLILQSDFPRTNAHESIRTVVCMGSIVSETLRRKFSELFPEKNLIILYGMTECGVSGTAPDEYKESLTVGSQIFPNLSLKIVDESGEKLGVNEVGELCLKSTVKFLGYYNNPEATANALDEEGYFKSGDVGYFDATGKLFITDRKKEVVKCKGHQVTLSEIENLIESIEGVKTVSVVGITDLNCDTLLSAVIVKNRDFNSLTESSIAAAVAAQLPVYKHLAGVFFVDELPTTPSGKIKKRLVSEFVRSRNSIGGGLRSV